MWSAARRPWIIYALTCDVLAVALTAADLTGHRISEADLRWFGILLVLGIGQAEMSRRIERVRRWMGGQTHINVTSVWFVAGATLLTPGWNALLSAFLYLHIWARVWRQVRSRPAHRVVVSTALIMLSCFAASYAVRASGLGDLADAPPSTIQGTGVVILGAASFELVNLVLVAIAIYLYTEERSVTDLLGTWADNALELVTLCLGGLVALALVYQPFLVLLVFPPLIMLHRNVLLKQLEVAAATDDKTGLFNAFGWRDLASRELARAQRSHSACGVLMVDLDHFKRVNDTYGHLAGDSVLRAVGELLRAEVRDYDVVGRFGGEEFAVLLPDITEQDSIAIAERIRAAVMKLEVSVEINDHRVATISGLSVSIGVAVCPESGTVVDRLLLAADTALYKAKNDGRNTVVSVGSSV
ncbi:MAG TPA: GGDEF domain-containing protein [Actinophytocola sp.]|uniref:GGDEF domain-containing protein n=1 Tax=Actinophytocola sp. TaxID=1872138 RepID=UPI002DBDF220|nr:GGDEF domain-containing protein [Actinophytocola sp.]HEU5471550.1 GGDEF domain-containing protein [Actinophytocola sp.]